MISSVAPAPRAVRAQGPRRGSGEVGGLTSPPGRPRYDQRVNGQQPTVAEFVLVLGGEHRRLRATVPCPTWPARP